jgi:putative selenium metabolism hydrolase
MPESSTPDRTPGPDFDAAIEFAQDLIRIPGLSGDEEAVCRRVLKEYEQLGLTDVRHDAFGNAIGRVPGSDPDAPSVMVNAHLDVVASGEPDEWEHPPFAADIADGCLHGRGAMDIKGPLALLTYGAAALAGRTPGDVWVVHTVYEERGGLGMHRLLEAGDVRPDAVLIGESTHGDVCVGHRGRAEVEVVLKGRAGHASAPDRARNALELVPAVLEAVERVAANQPVDSALGVATLVPTSIDVLPETRNVIPDRVTVVLDWRILPGMEDENLLATIRRAITERIGSRGPPGDLGWEVRMAAEYQRTWTGHEETRSVFMPGFDTGVDHPVAVAAAQAAGRRGELAPARIRPWTFATDGGWSRGTFGIPTIGFAPGEERHAHTNVERLDLDEAAWALQRIPRILLAMQEALTR